MYKIVILLMLFATLANAQPKPAASSKNPPVGKGKKAAKADSLKKDSVVKFEEPKIPREFMVYTRKPRAPKERYKLCFNLVTRDTVLNYCMNDSLCKDPEVAKVLFEQRQGDTLYMLILVDAFTKIDATNDDGRCNSGKETKLVFTKWNTKTNEAKWKQKNVSSCSRGITNMTKEPIDAWDGNSVLTVIYHRGQGFYEVKFDPAQYQLGLQSGSESEAK